MTPLALEIWNARYRLDSGVANAEADIAASWRRVAEAVAAAEDEPQRWQDAFVSILSDFRFLPGGRILAGAGAGRQVTLINCFVSGPISDSLDGILESLRETAVTMQKGGGIGLDFSALRPSGATAARTGTVASGPVTFMHTWDALCETLLSTSSRRGAMMGTLRCDHPDIEAFIGAKRGGGALRNFNLSVLITDAFMQALDEDGDWPLTWPAAPAPDARVYDRMAAHDTAEPGVLFIDTVNRNNNLYYCETISATNPCGEIPLPPFGACDIGSINLTKFIDKPFANNSRLDADALGEVVRIAVRFLDDVIDISHFPLEQQAAEARKTRRIGLGITGLGDALAMLGLHYDSSAARAFAASAMCTIRNNAYRASVETARSKGAFPAFDRDPYLDAPFVRRLPGKVRDAIASHGVRNSHLLAIAPAGSISLLAGNVSSGIEPIYALDAMRIIRDRQLNTRERDARDYAFALWSGSKSAAAGMPACLVTADMLPATAHLDMQACLQPYVDGAISKTVNLPPAASVGDVAAIYASAYRLGIKGCTVFRPGTCTGQVIRNKDGGAAADEAQH